MTRSATLDAFAELSAALTGFDAPHLVGTGNAETFWDLLVARAGPDNAEALLAAWSERVLGAADQERALRLEVLSDPRLGPMARNLMRLWYVGVWRQMPADWRTSHASGLDDSDVIPASRAYTEGLLWTAVGANPPGAKPFGYGMWAKPPRVTLDPKETSHA